MQILEVLNQYTKLFLESKKAASGSKNSLRSYTLILERFYDFVANEVNKHEKLLITDINRYFLNNYIIHLDQQDLSRRTQHQHINLIKQFLIFIADSDLAEYSMLKSNLSGIKVKFEQKEAESFNADEQQRIIGLIKQLDQAKNFTAQRNSLILKILLFHGVRIDERFCRNYLLLTVVNLNLLVFSVLAALLSSYFVILVSNRYFSPIIRCKNALAFA